MEENNKTNYLTPVTNKKQFTIQTDGTSPNQKSIPGDSVDEHKNLEVANAIISGDEIKQQNENL
ncbi:hypothetical protein ACFFIX_02730 [Metabacillus herbersteinensis]|uniref:DUF4025 domain-containing protein n=1 Tax=Metabacillus herbersteinensis TaxID=283816 RepID=A0ABV6G9Z5_9BACI